MFEEEFEKAEFEEEWFEEADIVILAEEYELTYRIIDILKDNAITTISNLIEKTERGLLEIPGIGKDQLDIIIAALEEHRLSLRDAKPSCEEVVQVLRKLTGEVSELRHAVWETLHLQGAVNHLLKEIRK